MSVDCPQCHAPNPDEALYCVTCGQLLIEYEPELPDEPAVQTFASRLSRLVASILDGVIAGAAIVVLLFVSPEFGLLLVLAIFVVQAVLLTRDGQTIGKRALNIHIVLYRTGENGGFVPNVLLRVVVSGLLGIVPFYGLVDALFIFRNDRRCIHDFIAGTVVVKA